jgi:hypothetical protein
MIGLAATSGKTFLGFALMPTFTNAVGQLWSPAKNTTHILQAFGPCR